MREPLPAHMDKQEISLFKDILSKGGTYLEHGCGGSTVLAADSPISYMTSIDTNAEWIAKCAAQPSVAYRIEQEQARLLHINIGNTAAWGKPINKELSFMWPCYSIGVWSILHRLPDIVFVDGRWRVSCSLYALLRCNNHATIMIHDWPSRPQYHILLEFASIAAHAGALAALKPTPNRDLDRIAHLCLNSLSDYS